MPRRFKMIDADLEFSRQVRIKLLRDILQDAPALGLAVSHGIGLQQAVPLVVVALLAALEFGTELARLLLSCRPNAQSSQYGFHRRRVVAQRRTALGLRLAATDCLAVGAVDVAHCLDRDGLLGELAPVAVGCGVEALAGVDRTAYARSRTFDHVEAHATGRAQCEPACRFEPTGWCVANAAGRQEQAVVTHA